MKKYIALFLLCSSYLVAGTVSKKEVQYALDCPFLSCLTVRKKCLLFVDRAGYIQSVKLKSLKKKQRRLYSKLKAIHAKRSPYYSSKRKRQRKKKIVSFSSCHPSTRFIDQSQPVKPEILVDEWNVEDDYGYGVQRVRLYSTNRLSMDLS